MNKSSAYQPQVSAALLLIRIFLGVIFIAHGSQKLFGAFGGHGLAQTVVEMGRIGYMVSIGEFFGGLGILVGILPRFSAASLIVIMLGAIVTVHGKNGFFSQQGGFEYPFALIGMSLAVLAAGPGAFAISSQVSLKRAPGGSLRKAHNA
jgi:putative oxidoreductase